MNTRNKDREMRRVQYRVNYLANMIAQKVCDGQTVLPSEIAEYKRAMNCFIRKKDAAED